MTHAMFQELARRIEQGTLVPYLGPDALAEVRDTRSGERMPADNESLILAMNSGQPMTPRLMVEFSRAAMHLELKRGRKFVSGFLTELYGGRLWTRSRLHQWLFALQPPYIVDVNRDLQLQEVYQDTPHTLIRGVARLGGSDYRFRIHESDGSAYREIDQEAVDPSLPILFKPMGTPLPDSTFVASDADYVDYITELMGGFAIPAFLKQFRLGKQYLVLGLRLTHDTERMILSDIVYGSAEPTGWALIPNPTRKEQRFCRRIGLEIIEAELDALLESSERSVA